MAAPTNRLFREVIDLTGDDDNTIPAPVPATHPPSSASKSRVPRVDVNRVHGSYAYANPLPASPHPPKGHDTGFGPPAKRQRLSESPRAAKLTDAQHVTASISAGLWPYAKAAVENIADARVDKAKLQGEVGNKTPSGNHGVNSSNLVFSCHCQVKDALLQYFNDLLRNHGGLIPKALHNDIDDRARVLAKNFSKLPVRTERPSRFAKTNIIYTGIPSTTTFCDTCDTCDPSSSKSGSGHTSSCASRSVFSSRASCPCQRSSFVGDCLESNVCTTSSTHA